MSVNSRYKGKLLRKSRIRKKVFGTAERPRLTIYKSLKFIYIQVIDDLAGKTLHAVSTAEKGTNGNGSSGKNMEAATQLGTRLGDAIKAKGIKSVVVDRNGYLYHGKVAGIVDKVRESGISV